MIRATSAALVTLLLCACGGSPADGNSEMVGNMAPPALGPDGKPFKVEVVGEFAEPFALTFLADGRALVTEKGGKLKLWQSGRPLIDIAGAPNVASVGQGGLLDVAVSPDFATSRNIYLTFSETRPGGTNLALARARLNLESGAPRLEDAQVIWRAGSAGDGGHFGATMAFSPDGRHLFLTAGDRQRFAPAQDMNQRLGKILRLTLDGRPAPGNPWEGKAGTPTVGVIDPPENSGSAAKARVRTVAVEGVNTAPAEIWSLGHRNPYGLAFAPDGRLWETEMGPKGGDELNLIEKGKNYGYPLVSNGQNYDDSDIPNHDTRPEFKAPAAYWDPSISPAGLIFYRGDLWPQWKGSAFLGALSGESLIRVEVNGATARKAEQWQMDARIRDVAEGIDGALYLLGDDGKLMKLTPVG